MYIRILSDPPPQPNNPRIYSKLRSAPFREKQSTLQNTKKKPPPSKVSPSLLPPYHTTLLSLSTIFFFFETSRLWIKIEVRTLIRVDGGGYARRDYRGISPRAEKHRFIHRDRFIFARYIYVVPSSAPPFPSISRSPSLLLSLHYPPIPHKRECCAIARLYVLSLYIYIHTHTHENVYMCVPVSMYTCRERETETRPELWRQGGCSPSLAPMALPAAAAYSSS